ncbi:AraC family transcriptional regulator [Pseudonocardia halophobica]|uniref:Transcriptional regulator n=1 Tax=Pseudonocardia halophobica TaxID=29401 RepID=A0A9W6NU17_9PSEU|nr:AraC family transcriptional regulator [Pseudonocardia halophobica]GLL09865.1 transcriptional regulator [Pseudonocardia halophobica]
MSRGVSYATADADEARELASRTFSEHDLRLVDGHPLEFRLDLVPSARLTVGRMSYGADATLAGPSMRTCYHVNLATVGESQVSQHGRRETAGVGRAGVAFLPDGPLEVRWSPDAVQYALKFPKELLESHAAKLAGTPPGEPIRFDLTFDLSSPTGRSLVATAAFLHAQLARPGGLAEMPVACHELEAALMTQLLMVVPSQFSARLRRREPNRRARVRLVVDHLDAHPEKETTTAELAELAGIGPRALQAGFQELVGLPPLAYLRAVRLDRVHAELAAGGRSVTEVAAAWGFYQPGRFARLYRERFGELPSQTAGGPVTSR